MVVKVAVIFVEGGGGGTNLGVRGRSRRYIIMLDIDNRGGC